MLISELAGNLGLEQEEFTDIFKVYMETTALDLEGLKIAINNGDAEDVHRRAHSIKGASGNMGLYDLYELAKRIDDKARGNVLVGAETLVRDLEQGYEKLVLMFEKRKETY